VTQRLVLSFVKIGQLNQQLKPGHTATQQVDLVNLLSILLGNENKLKVSANWIVYRKLVLNCTENSRTPVLLIRDVCRHIV